MSQFPAQIAFTPAAQGARRNLPVDVPTGTGIPAIQPAAGGAPGLPGVAALPAPVPDLSAARDLEQALRATQALGNTLVDVGNALNIQRQIDDRKSVYDARLRFEKDSLKFEEEYAAGKYNGQIDATDDAQAFVDNWSTRYVDPSRTAPVAEGEQLTAGEAEYRERMGKLAGTAWVRRRAERQKELLKEYARGEIVGLVDPIDQGSKYDVESGFRAAQERFPYLNRLDYVSAVPVAAMEAMANSGDIAGVERIAASFTDDRERNAYVAPIIRSARVNAARIANERMNYIELETSKILTRGGNVADRVNDVIDLVHSIEPDEESAGVFTVKTLAEMAKNAGSVEQLRSIDAAVEGAVIAGTVSGTTMESWKSAKSAFASKITKNVLTNLAADPESDFGAQARDALDSGLVSMDDVADLAESHIRRRNNALEVAAIATANLGKYDDVVKGLTDAVAMYDRNRPEWDQPDGAISMRSAQQIIEAVEKSMENDDDSSRFEAVVAGVATAKPDDSKWRKWLDGNGLASGTVIDGNRLGMIMEQSKVIPHAAVDAILSGLRRTTPDATDPERARMRESIVAVMRVAPYLTGPSMMAQFTAFELKNTDPVANAPVIKALRETLPVMASMPRQADGGYSQEQVDAVMGVMESNIKRYANTTVVDFNAREIQNRLNASTLGRASEIKATIAHPEWFTLDKTGKSSIRVSPGQPMTLDAIFVATQEAMSLALQNDGVGASTASALAEIAATEVINDTVNVIGDNAFDAENYANRVNERINSIRSDYVYATVDGKTFGYVERNDGTKRWDEKIEAELKSSIPAGASVTAVFPYPLSDGNFWGVVFEKDGAKTAEILLLGEGDDKPMSDDGNVQLDEYQAFRKWVDSRAAKARVIK